MIYETLITAPDPWPGSIPPSVAQAAQPESEQTKQLQAPTSAMPIVLQMTTPAFQSVSQQDQAHQPEERSARFSRVTSSTMPSASAQPPLPDTVLVPVPLSLFSKCPWLRQMSQHIQSLLLFPVFVAIFQWLFFHFFQLQFLINLTLRSMPQNRHSTPFVNLGSLS